MADRPFSNCCKRRMTAMGEDEPVKLALDGSVCGKDRRGNLLATDAVRSKWSATDELENLDREVNLWGEKN